MSEFGFRVKRLDIQSTDWLIKLIPNIGNISINWVGGINEYEYPTLDFLYQNASQKNIGYFHTKGVSRPLEYRGQWRRVMMKNIIERWRDVEMILSYSNICGWDWCKIKELIKDCPLHEDSKTSHGFFAGNFWWGRLEYIKNLPSIKTLKKVGRFEAESWIGLSPNKPKIFCMKSNKPF